LLIETNGGNTKEAAIGHSNETAFAAIFTISQSVKISTILLFSATAKALMFLSYMAMTISNTVCFVFGTLRLVDYSRRRRKYIYTSDFHIS
jgi:hypothetical protein